MKRLFKNDGTLLFGYWIREHWKSVPQSYLRWGCENVPNFDLQLERLKQGLDPLPGISDGTKALPVAKPPVRKTFVSKTVRPMNHTPTPVDLFTPPSRPLHPVAEAHAAGMTRKQIAQHVGLALHTVDKRIAELGLPKPRDGRKGNTVCLKALEKARAVKAAKRLERVEKPSGPSLKIQEGRISWTPEIEDQMALWLAQGHNWKFIAEKLKFKPGGSVLCTRYHARKNFPNRVAKIKKPIGLCPCVDKTIEIKKSTTPPRRNLFRRVWDAFFKVDPYDYDEY